MAPDYHQLGIDKAVQILKLVIPGVGFIPVVGEELKSSLELVVVICELAEKVAANQEMLIDLALYCARLLTAIVMECQRLGVTSSGLKFKHLVDLQKTLEEIRDTAEEMVQAKGVLGRAWNVDKDKATIEGLRNKLDQAVGEFTVVSSIRSLAEANDTRTRVEDLQSAVRELKSEMEQHRYLDAAEQGRISALRPVLSARHDHETARAGCLENTREILLAEIFQWIYNESADDKIYWLTGLGGTGKSTIAQTVSESLVASSPSKLAASFFFSRYEANRKNPENVIRTIAYHLASLTPQLRSLISEALRENPDVPSRSMQDQARDLLGKPLSKACDLPLPIVFVFDALDECEGSGRQLMTTLANTLIHSLPDVHVKIFITSRFEPEIRSMFESIPHKPYKLHDIEASVVQGDIKSFFVHSFVQIRQRRHNPSLANWPSEKEITALVERAGVLFIFAATVIKYIDVRAPPEPRLHALLSTDVVHDDRYKALDDLYLQVMRSAIDDKLNTVSQELQRTRLRTMVAMIVVLQDPLPAHALSRMIGFGFSEVVDMLGALSAVLLLPDNIVAGTTEVIRLLHPSFPDFIVNASRCTEPCFLVDLPSYHAAAASRCFELMTSGLKRDICCIRNPSLLNSEVVDLQNRISKHIPLELRYACKYWPVHLQLASAEDNNLLKSLTKFCEEKILEWIECCSLLEVLPEVLLGLRVIISQATNVRVSDITAALLRDTERLMIEFYTPISASALHVYYSAAPWMPQCTLLERIVKPGSEFPQLLSKRENQWNPSLQTIEGHSEHVSSLSMSPDGLRLVSGSWDHSVRIWDTRTGAPIAQLDGHTDWVTAVAFSPNGTRVASGGDDKTTRIWDAVTFSLIAELDGHSRSVRAVCFSPDGTRLVSGSDDYTARVWDIHQEASIITLQGHTGWIQGVVFTHDGSYVISCSNDCSIRVWNPQTGDVIKQFDGHCGYISCVAVTHSDLKIVSGSQDRTIGVWDISTGKLNFSLKGHNDDVNCVALTPDDSHILSGSDDKTIRIWNMQARTCVSVLSSHIGVVTSLAIPPNGLRLFSGSYDRTIRVWDLSSLGAEDLSLTLAQGKRDQLKARISSSIRNVRQTITDVRERGMHLVKSLTSDSGTVLTYDMTPDGMYVVTGHENHSVCLWGQSGERLIRKLSGHSGEVYSVAFSSDGAWIISGSGDKTVRVWETKTGKALAKLKEHRWSVESVAISADRNTIASGSFDGAVRLWRTDTWSHQRTLEGHNDFVLSVVFSSNNRRIASGSSDCTVRIWDTATGDSIAILQATNWVLHVRFRHRDSQVAAMDRSGIVYAWDLQSNGLRIVDDPPPPIAHVDAAGWLWMPVVPDGPTRRICWLPSRRRPVHPFLSDTPDRFRASGTHILTAVALGGLVTRFDISRLLSVIT